MSYTVETPNEPTHAIQHIDNWDGEGDILFSFVFMVADDYYHFENGSPVLECQGDEIINIWELNQGDSK